MDRFVRMAFGLVFAFSLANVSLDAQSVSISFGSHGARFDARVGSTPTCRVVRRGHVYAGHRPHRRAYEPVRTRREAVRVRVWVPGTTRRVWIAPEYGFRVDRCGRRIRYVVRSGYWDEVCTPGYWEWRTEYRIVRC